MQGRGELCYLQVKPTSIYEDVTVRMRKAAIKKRSAEIVGDCQNPREEK